MIAFANAYAYINNQGYFLEISKDKLELPILTGFLTKEEDIQEGNRLCVEDLQRLDDVLQIMKSATSNEVDSLVTKINIANQICIFCHMLLMEKQAEVHIKINCMLGLLY